MVPRTVTYPLAKLALIAALLPAPVWAQQPADNPEAHQAQPAAIEHQREQQPAAAQGDSAESEQPRERIVDPAKFPPKSPLPARILLAPFRALAPKVERGLTSLENTQVLSIAREFLRDPHARPLIGGLGDGSGFGGGVALSTADSLPGLQFFGTVRATTKKYTEMTAGIRSGTQSEKVEKFYVKLIGIHRLRPQEDFWGIGAGAPPLRTNYDLQERGADLSLNLRPQSLLKFGVGFNYSSNSVFPGKDQRFPTTQSQFSPLQVPGLAEGAALLSGYFFAEFDSRKGASNPVHAGFIRLGVSSNDSVGSGDFGYWNYTLDARYYAPMGSEHRVLAMRTLLEFNSPKGGSQVPFFRLARLGDRETLRGYDTYRFHARNAAAWNVEYRVDLTGGIGAFGFTDFGQVFNDWSEFSSQFFRITYGGGLQFKSRKKIFLRVYVGKSEEGTRFFFTFGPTF
ncbi:MAG TPA: BamA/TamA family outer membrane protein [Terriglobales bacterium]|nr:BamA/TamA family outer membrane protein [Terriglobales bacterium]